MNGVSGRPALSATIQSRAPLAITHTGIFQGVCQTPFLLQRPGGGPSISISNKFPDAGDCWSGDDASKATDT